MKKFKIFSQSILPLTMFTTNHQYPQKTTTILVFIYLWQIQYDCITKKTHFPSTNAHFFFPLFHKPCASWYLRKAIIAILQKMCKENIKLTVYREDYQQKWITGIMLYFTNLLSEEYHILYSFFLLIFVLFDLAPKIK